MLIGGKEYKTGQRIKVINAKSILHYKYGMTRDCNKDMTGITGVITAEKSKWFNMILSGDKQEEYREIKPYYTTRFKKIFEMYPNSNIPTGLDKQLIGFRNGYGSSRPQFTAVCSLDIKTGKEEWGAEPGTEYYTLHIHEIRERKDC